MKTVKYRTEPDGAFLRVFAVRDFGRVKAGEKGGLIESEENLSHEGDAWICGNALVSEGACVFENARVSENASVSGSALVSGRSRVSGNAYVSQRARLSGSAIVSENARVFGDACIFGSACVFGDARVFGTARVLGKLLKGDWKVSPIFIQGTRHAISVSGPDLISIGCETRNMNDWMAIHNVIGRVNGYTREEIAEYGRNLRFVIRQIRRK